MAHFANSYWSPDYIAGIERLSRQSALSLRQLHELRKFVFRHVEHHHAAGEQLAATADAYAPDSSFWQSRGPRQPGSRHVSRQSAAAAAAPPALPAADCDDVDMNYVFRQCTAHTGGASRRRQQLAARLDTHALEPLTSFLKSHEPVVRAALARLDASFGDYTEAATALERERARYGAMARLAEFSVEGAGRRPAEEPGSESDDDDDDDKPDASPPPSLGAMHFASAAELDSFVAALVSRVAVSRPKALFGDGSFSGEHLCEQLAAQKRRGFAPTRSNLEKAGQALVDRGLVVPSRYFVRQFSSEGSFRWSPAALHAHEARGESPADPQRGASAWTSVTSSTSKTLNGVLRSVKSSLAAPRHSQEDMDDAELDYNDAYKALHRARHAVESELFHQAQRLEHFEKLKIGVVFSTLAAVQAALSDHAQQEARAHGDFAAALAGWNVPQVHTREFDNTLATFSTGVYFPSAYAPAGGHASSTTKLNTNFQNIRLNFNLFKDIPLQLTLGAVCTCPLYLQSVPVFLHKLVSALEKAPKQALVDAWKAPLHHSRNHALQADVITALHYVPENSTETALLEKAVAVLDKADAAQQVGFLKSWLLETSDSVIPSTVYDSLVGHYKVNADRVAEMLRLLATIPRSNLGSLLFIMEHICSCFGFAPVDGSEGEPGSDNVDELAAVAAALNSTDAVASVPFLHLILRPSVAKHAKGFKPPAEQYNMLLCDLMASRNRRQLHQSLVANEKHYLERQEQQKKLGIHKPRNRSTSLTSAAPAPAQDPGAGAVAAGGKAPKSVAAHVTTPKAMKIDSFELRPFRTGTTPRPSPSSSPIHVQKRQDRVLDSP